MFSACCAVDDGYVPDSVEVSDGRAHVEQNRGSSELRRELGKLRLKELRRRAADAGVAHGLVDAAIDSDEPKAAMVTLLLEHEAAREAEFRGLSVRELRKRARLAGADEESLDDAVESEDPRAAVIAMCMLLERRKGAARSEGAPAAGAAAPVDRVRPHFGKPAA
eukprot:SAG11_NODE_5865_length_1445_cov_1.695394_1_plen_164_part_10